MLVRYGGYVTAHYVDALRCYVGVLQQCVTTVRDGSALQWYITVVRYADTLLSAYVCVCVCVCVHFTNALARHMHTFAWMRHTSK